MSKIKLPQRLDVSGYKSKEREAINALIGAVEKLQLVSGNGIAIKQGPGGITVSIDNNNTGTGTQALPRWL